MKYLVMVFCLLFAVCVCYSQGPGASHDKVYVCHKGQVIWVSSSALPAHLAHGDALAHQNSAGEWICPCPKPNEPPPEPIKCWDGSIIEWFWDEIDCKWNHKECPCEPTSPKPEPKLCWDGTLIDPMWDITSCTWIFKECPCEPTSPIPEPKLCWDGTIIKPIWDVASCTWIFKDCPCEPNGPPPPFPNICPNGQWVGWHWDIVVCNWVPDPCPQCQPGPQPPCVNPDWSFGCTWVWNDFYCKWIQIDPQTGKPYNCGLQIPQNPVLFRDCDCVEPATGIYIFCFP